MHINKKQAKSVFKDKLVTALTVAPALSVMIFSAAYNLIIKSMGYEYDSDLSVLMSCLTLFAMAASTVLAAVYRKRFAVQFFTILFSLCFICYLCFCCFLNEDMLASATAFILVISVPLWSYLPLAARFFASYQTVAVLVITGILIIVNAAAWIWIYYSEKRGKKVESEDKG